AATTSTTAAVQALILAAEMANTAQAASIATPANRTERVAVHRSRTLRAIRTWKNVTPSVLTISSEATTQSGASVCETIHSGATRLSSGMNSNMIEFSSARTAYGRSCSTA